MLKTKLRLLLLTTTFSTHFSLSTFAMNVDDEPSRQVPPTKQQTDGAVNATCDACWKPLRRNTIKREILSYDGMRLLSVCKKCFDEDKEEQSENEERQRIEDQIGFQSFLQLRPYFENLPAPRVVPTPPPAIPPNVQIPMRHHTNETTNHQ